MITCRACAQVLDPVLGRWGWGRHPNCEPHPGDDTDHATALRLLAGALGATVIETSPPRAGRPNPTRHNQGELL